MASAGADLTGSVALMANVAGGENSHSIISSFDSRAAREAWLQKLYASAAWADYAKATAGMTQALGSSRMDILKSWGTEDDADVFWEIHAFTASDADAFAASVDALMSSEPGKAFPGNVVLSVVDASGLSPVTHLIAVGFTGEAEAESATAAMNATADWAAYQKASRAAAAYGGTFMIRTIKSWGNTGE